MGLLRLGCPAGTAIDAGRVSNVAGLGGRRCRLLLIKRDSYTRITHVPPLITFVSFVLFFLTYSNLSTASLCD